MKNYKVCILAAGVGSRMGPLSEHINKAILPINFKGVISYIIEKFPKDVEIIIAVGHKKETIIDYLSLAYPERNFVYVEVDKFIGPGTGPGYSLLQCKDKLQCPFILTTADTIVLEEIPEPNMNWFGIAPVKETERYCTVKIKNNLICQIDDKVKTNNRFAFIGLAGVKDYETFFSALEKNRELIKGEIQLSNGFKKLIEKKLVPIGFTWFDTGSIENYIETNKAFSGTERKFDFSKGNEFIYFVNEKVIKFFADEEIVRKRYERSKVLEGLCPKIIGKRKNFYSYQKIEGQTLYSVLNNRLFTDFLHWAAQNLWKKIALSQKEKQQFYKICHKFYHEKTMKRLNLFYAKTNLPDTENEINGILVPQLRDLLKKIDWNWLCKGIPANFHGDLQFDNILVTRDDKSQLQKFILLDWRQDFAGLTEYGDLYYDLSKLYGGMNLSYQLIKEGKFSFDMSGSSVFYEFYLKNDLLEARELFERYLTKNNYDLQKVRILTSLIFLNMAPLHKDPFDLLLYFLGKYSLYKYLSYKND